MTDIDVNNDLFGLGGYAKEPVLASGEFGRTDLSPSEEERRLLGAAVLHAWKAWYPDACEHADPLCPCDHNLKDLTLFLAFFLHSGLDAKHPWFTIESFFRGEAAWVTGQRGFNAALRRLVAEHGLMTFEVGEPLKFSRSISPEKERLWPTTASVRLVYAKALSTVKCCYCRREEVPVAFQVRNVWFCSKYCLDSALRNPPVGDMVPDEIRLPADYLEGLRAKYL